jgi:hypothetical protein
MTLICGNSFSKYKQNYKLCWQTANKKAAVYPDIPGKLPQMVG